MEYLYVDSNVFNFLFDNGINLRKEFPADLYELRIIGEQDLENRAIPEGKEDLRKFIYQAIESYPIKVDRLFGFYDERHSDVDQRVGGYGVGRYASLEEIEFIRAERKDHGEKRRSGLYKDEADISLAARAMGGGIVISNDAKKGPLPRAKEQGGRVVFLNEFNPCRESLRAYVERLS
jgi:hypothetical protein